ncbi:BMC domain-containing protein [Clostridium sp. Cult2]|uniref:BMC domain-containing protein n=1 Tax=Clostridium sp. Cult2 TaxID=2079003 RepID=UPI00235113DE|nr:BMC domain-containing protein [Clostridium sp. Cult2]MCF6466269.1 ethanolamine utilization protein EutM [Clostridium sp. Cult2]
MDYKALGLIETYGYVAAIEAADACVKAANVNLIGYKEVTGGIVSIILQGDLSAVKSSIEAGTIAASILGKVISTTVIPRPAEGLEKIIDDYGFNKNKSNKLVKIEDSIEDVIEDKEKDERESTIEFEGKTINLSNEEELRELKVVELRKLARQLSITYMDSNEIKYAKKNELISAILLYVKRGEE